MAKCDYLKSPEEKLADNLEKSNKLLKAELNGAVTKMRTEYELTQDEFAEQVNINRGTFSNRLKNPGKLNLDEIFKLKYTFPAVVNDIVKVLTS